MLVSMETPGLWISGQTSHDSQSILAALFSLPLLLLGDGTQAKVTCMCHGCTTGEEHQHDNTQSLYRVAWLSAPSRLWREMEREA